MQLRMTINAILDARVHAHGMTEDEAMRLMMERGHQEEGEAAGKWRRALLTSGQLSTYYVGYVEVRRHRARPARRPPGAVGPGPARRDARPRLAARRATCATLLGLYRVVATRCRPAAPAVRRRGLIRSPGIRGVGRQGSAARRR